MEGVDAFRAEVMAYPAVTVIERRGRAREPITRVAIRPDPSPGSMDRLSSAMLREGAAADDRILEVRDVASGREPWLLDRPDQLRLLRSLEARFPPLSQVGCKVGIGVATGADAVFIGPFDALPVEPERKLPLAMASDLVGGVVRWGGRGVVNPFLDDGTLASFEDYPRFGAYLESHRERVAGRHVARKNPARWYRTIDRIVPGLTRRPKLLIPDIKGSATVAWDPGEVYPHHNLYYVVSDTWDLRALQAVLRSSVALWFVAAYCVRMSGGFLRFQAQYLRRIRVPRWDAVPERLRAALAEVACASDQAEVDAPVFDLYGLSPAQREVVTAAAGEARVPTGA